ncbi:Tn3 family transposase [Nonomuraea jabiensis]|uniref:Tn3 family transposase n=1 Tax=Nonomuraea jabiensis TaxID=882448 RepID=UPI0035E4028A
MVSELLGFKLLPRLKSVGSARLYRPGTGPETGGDEAWPRLATVLSNKTIDWDLIARHYDQMIKYATALRLRTADAPDAAPLHPRRPQAPHLPGDRGAGIPPARTCSTAGPATTGRRRGLPRYGQRHRVLVEESHPGSSGCLLATMSCPPPTSRYAGSALILDECRGSHRP